ncbi:MAG TPA: Dabb family protein [Clostridia bacterium]
MLTHIVMWKFLDEVDGHTKRENMAIVRQKLEDLRPQVPQILHMELHEDIGADRNPFDMVLITRFDDAQSLQAYQAHPAHKAVSAFVSTVRSDRAVVDYITEG